MTEELTAALARAKAVAERVLAHYGHKRQSIKALEEMHEAQAAAYRLVGCTLAMEETGIDSGEEGPARAALVGELADAYIAGCAVNPTIPHPPTDEEFTESELAAAIDAKSAAMEARMDRIDAMKRNGEVPTP